MTLGNSNGAVNIFDYGAPKVITAYAREAISGGELVFASGATGVVGSGADSFTSTDVEVAIDASGADFLGVALKNGASGASVPIALDGAFLMNCIGAVTNSQNVTTYGGGVVAGVTAGQVVGRALTAGASGGFALIDLK